jgi:hypothetical protein
VETPAPKSSSLFFASGQIQAIVIDLVGGANLQTEVLQGPDDAWIRFADEGPQLAGDTKERGCLHLDNPVVVGRAQFETIAPLSLNDLARANVRGGIRYAPEIALLLKPVASRNA